MAVIILCGSVLGGGHKIPPKNVIFQSVPDFPKRKFDQLTALPPVIVVSSSSYHGWTPPQIEELYGQFSGSEDPLAENQNLMIIYRAESVVGKITFSSGQKIDSRFMLYFDQKKYPGPIYAFVSSIPLFGISIGRLQPGHYDIHIHVNNELKHSHVFTVEKSTAP